MKSKLKKRPRNRLFQNRRLIIALLAIIFFASGALIWILNIQGIFQGPWAKFLPILFTILSVALPFFQGLFPSFPDKKEQHKNNSLPGNTSLNLSSANPITRVDTLKQPPLTDLKTSQQSQKPTESQEQLEVARTRPDSVFLFNVPLTDPHEFYGRMRERMTLIGRTRNGASTSIVGPRKIGKTWLISYLRLAASQELDIRFRIGYLDATMASCATVPEFILKSLEELGISTSNIDKANIDLTVLERAVKDLRSKNRSPVICIDEFERFSDRQSFDLNFFTSLRAMTQFGLILVVASKSPLIEVVGDYGNTSGFFNVFEQLTLKPFTAREAEIFVQAKGAQAGFTEEEQKRLLQYGQEIGTYWPLRLQLTGKLLLEDKVLSLKENDSSYYRPSDTHYWHDFEERLKEKYRGVVRT